MPLYAVIVTLYAVYTSPPRLTSVSFLVCLQSGEVLLDGRPVACYSPAWLKRRVALVGQEPVLFGARCAF